MKLTTYEVKKIELQNYGEVKLYDDFYKKVTK